MITLIVAASIAIGGCDGEDPAEQIARGRQAFCDAMNRYEDVDLRSTSEDKSSELNDVAEGFFRSQVFFASGNDDKMAEAAQAMGESIQQLRTYLGQDNLSNAIEAVDQQERVLRPLPDNYCGH